MLSQLVELIKSERPQFVSLEYAAKTTGGLSRYLLNIGTSYLKYLEKKELEFVIAESVATGIEKALLQEMIISTRKSIDAHKAGTQSDDYNLKDLYEEVVNGLYKRRDGSTSLLLKGQVLKTVRLTPKVKERKYSEKQILEHKLNIPGWQSFCVEPCALQLLRARGSEYLPIGMPNYQTINGKGPIDHEQWKD